MYLSVLSDEELEQYLKRVSNWLSDHKREKIAPEFDRRGLKVLDPIEKARIEKARGRIEEAREKAQNVLEREWRRQGCAKDSSGNWKVPCELLWRSLPRGEDR
jgi:hypothetical protein